MWLCLFFHKWGKWSEVITDGDKVQLKHQRRCCSRCGLIQRKNL